MLKSNLRKNLIHYMLENPKGLTTLILRLKFQVFNNGPSAGNQIVLE